MVGGWVWGAATMAAVIGKTRSGHAPLLRSHVDRVRLGEKIIVTERTVSQQVTYLVKPRDHGPGPVDRVLWRRIRVEALEAAQPFDHTGIAVSKAEGAGNQRTHACPTDGGGVRNGTGVSLRRIGREALAGGGLTDTLVR